MSSEFGNDSRCPLGVGFFLLWQGQLISQLGDQAFIISAIFWIKHCSESGTLVGLLRVLSSLPLTLLGPLGGVIADRFSRRKVLIACDLISGLSVMSLSFVMLSRISFSLKLILLLVVAVTLKSIYTVYGPTVSALVSDIVPPHALNRANSLLQGSAYLSSSLGKVIGGMIYNLLGPMKLFLIDGITFILSAISEFFIPEPAYRPPQVQDRFGLKTSLNDFREGLNYVLSEHGLRDLSLSASFLNFFSAPIFALLPFFVENVLGQGPEWYGFILGGFSLANIMGFTVASTLKIRGAQRAKFLITSLLAVVILLALAITLSSVNLLAGICIALTGIPLGFFNIEINSAIQRRTPRHLRGRVFALLSTFSSMLTPIGVMLGGILFDISDGRLIVIYNGCIVGMLLVMLWILMNRSILRLLVEVSVES